MDQQNQTFQECLSLYCITSFFLHFWIRKLQKTKNSVKTKHHHLQKKSSNCYQCISGFKYCSSPEISSSVLGIQDQGGGSLWSLFLGIVLEVEAKVKEGGVHWPSWGRLLWKSDSVGQNFDHWLSVSSWGHLFFSIVSALNSCFGQFIQPHAFILNSRSLGF